MKQTMVISVTTTGRVGSMHFDSFNLAFLGEREIKRASDIVFSQQTGTWDIYMNNGKGVFTLTSPQVSGFKDYEEARRFEVKWLNECRLREVVPTTPYGLFVLAGQLRVGTLYLEHKPA